MLRRKRMGLRPFAELLDDRCLLSGYSPTQIRHAYGFDSFQFLQNGKAVSANGAGQTVAIIEFYHDPNIVSNLRTFDTFYGLPAANLAQYTFPNTRNDDRSATEEALDVEYVHAIAPAASIVVVEAHSNSSQDLGAAVDFARNLPGVSVISMSFGGGEYTSQRAYDAHFTTPRGHTGVTFVASSGDSGARPGVEYPASSPNVVGVGGTTLYVNAAGNYAGESAWSGSGGGFSQVEPEPAYQRSVQSSGVRTVPDVSFEADPNTGVFIYATNPSNGAGGWQIYGGTSLSAPIFAALIAIADQGRAVVGKAPLDGPTQTLPAIYSAAFNSDFHDITSGSNGYRATAGYDLDTGRGTPLAFNFVRDLLNVASRTSFASTALTATTTTNGGLFKVNRMSVARPLALDTSASPPEPAPARSLDVVVLAPPQDAPSLAARPASETTPADVHNLALSLIVQDDELDWFV